MNRLTRMKYYMDSLSVFNFEEDAIFSALYDLLCSDEEKRILCQSRFFSTLSSAKSLREHISHLILTGDNLFTKAACAGTVCELAPAIISAVKSDLKKLEEISALTAQDILKCTENDDIKSILDSLPAWEIGEPLSPLKKDWDKQLDELADYYKKNGYGIYAKHYAFTWRNKRLCPVESMNLITLDDLKNYDNQRQRVIDNTESFLAGHPANNVLLYGDRGTGKSSTVHALLSKYKDNGLRMIEIPKSAAADLTLIREQIAGSPMKFIVFIDDLSFESNSDAFSELKAALEGCLSGRQKNMLIYATSNRRHLIRESFSDRENDVNRNDIMQEQLSLSDRFGLTITFLNPGKSEYLDIVQKLAIDKRLDEYVDMDKLCLKADQWATRKGGRSPRCAKQFIDHVLGCEAAGREW